MGQKSRALRCAVAVLLCAALLCGCNRLGSPELINVSYDPTREFYEQYNALFNDYWYETTGRHVEVIQSHGGSGSQALAVSQGLPADVVTLALEADVQAIADEGLIDDGWIDEFPNDSSPYTSTIVFLVRAGNPKDIQDWGDLIREDVGVITPNPKTSGGARWNFLAAWAWADNRYNGNESAVEQYIAALYQNVLVLDSGARGSTTSFVENGQGDVLITWENEGYLAMEEYPGEYELVSPSVSILCQPSVAIVDEVTRVNGTRRLATAYLNYLYSDEAQHLAAQYYYRPSNEEILSQYGDRFDLTMELVTISDFGGWAAAQEKYFADGGVFDSIYENLDVT
jgi:sulfate transport system substrate-binding protein